MKKAIILLVLFFAPVFTQVTSVIVNVGTRIITFNHLPKSTVTFGLGAGAADASGDAVLPVSIASNRMNPAGIQFDVIFSTADVNSITGSAGPVATAAGKGLTCNALSAGIYRCLATAVNNTTMANGIVANLAININKATSLTIQNETAATVAGTALNTAVSAPATAPISVVVALANVTCPIPSWDASAGLLAGTYNIEPNESYTCTAVLSQPAPAGGFPVGISAGTSGLTLPASVMIPGGATSATFQVVGQ